VNPRDALRKKSGKYPKVLKKKKKKRESSYVMPRKREKSTIPAGGSRYAQSSA
jgi:hypothetical protein